MAGLILLAVLIGLIALLIWLSGLLTRRLSVHANWKLLLRFLIVIGAFPLMVADEIIGKQQFETLCKKNGIESVDFSAFQGRSLKLSLGQSRLLKNTILPIDEYPVIYQDPENSKVLIEYKDYYSFGGWLMRNTPLSMGSPRPLLFSSSCEANRKLRKTVLAKFNVSIIN